MNTGDYMISFMFIGLVIASVISIGLPKRKDDPLKKQPTTPRERTADPTLNSIARDPARSRGYVEQLATSEPISAVSDAMVLQACSEIVNNDSLTQDAKVVALDALYQRTANYHPQQMAADVLEVIRDESTAVMYPHWKGAHGDFQSMKRG